ncbi:hypothetical protein AVEN_67424-1, partial [Araneus ventricosus]
MSKKGLTVQPILENILLEYIINVLVENPENMIRNSEDYFNRLMMTTDTTDQESSALSLIQKKNKDVLMAARNLRGKSVLERNIPKENEEEEEIASFPKTIEERKRIEEQINYIPFFRALDEQVIKKIVDALMP